MALPSPARRLLLALSADLDQAGITRPTNVNDPSRPPLWVEPDDGAPAPGEKSGTENDPATMVSLFFSGGTTEQGWERQHTVDLWFRTKGNRPMLRAMDLDETIRERLMPSALTVGDQRTDFLLAEGLPQQLRVISVRQWRDLSRLGSSEGQGYTFICSYLFQLYRVQP